MVLHDLHLALRYATTRSRWAAGARCRRHGGASVLSAAALSALFGHRLVAVGDGTTRSVCRLTARHSFGLKRRQCASGSLRALTRADSRARAASSAAHSARDAVDEARARAVQEIGVDGEEIAARDRGQRRPALPVVEPRRTHRVVGAGDDRVRLRRQHRLDAHRRRGQRQRGEHVLAAAHVDRLR